MERNRLRCAMCHYSTFLQRNLLLHYVRNHRYDPRFFVVCGSSGCGATYRNWSSFKKHLQRNHRENALNEDGPLPQEEPEIAVHDLPGELQENNDGAVCELNNFDSLKWQAAKFLLQIRDQCRTSHNAMLKVKEGTKHLLQGYSSLIFDAIMKEVDIDNQVISVPALQRIFEEWAPSSDVFSLVETKTDFDQFLVNELQMIMPQEIELGRDLVWQRKPVVDLVEKTYKGYSISILKALKRLLLNDQVRFCVENPRNFAGTYRTILDGNYYKTHHFFSNNVNALAIILYYDELEIVNPLGPKTHKMGMFYWTLANIYPEYRSTLQAINLLAVAKYSHIVKYGLEKLLKSFVEDINTLQTEGITISVNNVEKTYKGSLIMVTGDTPASAFLGGFKQSVSKAVKPCRRCLTDQDQWKLYFQERNFTLRDQETHLEHLSALEEDNITVEARNFWSQTYGINKRSTLMGIDGFDVTKCLVQDIMHVLSEGVLEVGTRVFLSFLIRNGFIRIETLNQKIIHFDYGHLSKDRPSPIIQAHLENGLRQTSAQMLSLSHLLPFLIGDNLTHEDADKEIEAQQRLLCHVRMMQITNMCFAFKISSDDVNFLEHLIQNFLYKFKQLYPDAMVPKFHFLVHIVSQMFEFGPARQHFCMRFEAAHAWYKGLMRVIRNLKNIPWTFSYRQESLRCSELVSSPGKSSIHFLYQGHSIKSGLQKKLLELQHSQLLFELLQNVDRNECEVMVSPEVSVYGTVYRPGSILLISCEEEDLPVFARTVEIYIHRGDIFLLYKPLKNLGYYDNLNAYLVVVDADSNPGIIRVENLLHPFPLSLYMFKGFKYVILFNFSRPEFIN